MITPLAPALESKNPAGSSSVLSLMRCDTPLGVLRVFRPEAGEEREAVFDPETHGDISALPETEISQRLSTGNTAPTQSGEGIAAGAEPPGAS